MTSTEAVPPHPAGAVRTVLCDLDGVVWLAHRPIAGSVEAVARLRDRGVRVVFVTNNSMSTMAEHEESLSRIGIPAAGDVVSSAQAAASMVAAGDRVLACAGAGVIEALDQRGAVVVTSPPVDAVVVGLHRDFDYERLLAAATAVRAGARLIGTNEDPTFPTPDGPIPGGGAILAAVSTAAGAAPEVAGKPHPPMARLVRERCGEGFDPRTAWMVGDRPSTDGAFARQLGCRFALVRTGVMPPGAVVGAPEHEVRLAPDDLDLPDLAAVAVSILG